MAKFVETEISYGKVFINVAHVVAVEQLRNGYRVSLINGRNYTVTEETMWRIVSG